MKYFLPILAFILAFVAASCKKDGSCHLKNGVLVSEQREAGKIDTITVYNNVNVVISTSASYGIKVEAEENLLPFIETQVEGGKLTVRNRNKCNFLRKPPEIKVYVEVPALACIEHMGSGKISSTNTLKSAYFGLYNYNMGDTDISMKTDFIYVHSRGGGDVKLSGQAERFMVNFSNTGMIYSEGFVVRDLSIKTTSTGDAYLNVTEKLEVQIEGKGNVYYKGDPSTMEHSQVGDGKLVKL